MPFWRMAPPMRRRCRCATAINAFDPASSDPPGAPSPLLNATATRSKGADSVSSATPLAALAFHKRAPSRKVASPNSCATAQMRSTSCWGTTTPPARLCVFSTSTRVVVGKIAKLRGLVAARNSSAVNTPRCPISWICTPALAAAPPASCQAACDSTEVTTSSPGRVKVRKATWLAMVPLGNHSAASLPSMSATRACRRLVLGSSPYWSSPTSAAAIAARMAGVGRVTVSERRSMGAFMGSVLVVGVQTGGLCAVLLTQGLAVHWPGDAVGGVAQRCHSLRGSTFECRLKRKVTASTRHFAEVAICVLPSTDQSLN